MAFDSFSLHAMVPNLREQLLGRRLRDIVHVDALDIVLRFRRTAVENSGPCLLLSAHPSHARTHLVGSAPKSSERRHFADVLGTHLFGRDLLDISQVDLDRVFVLRFDAPKDPLAADPGHRLLIAEMMGKHSNLILVDDASGRVLEAIKHVDATRNRVREVVPGSPYVGPPAPGGADPFSMTRETFMTQVDPYDDPTTWKQIVKAVSGFSPALAKYVVAAADDPESIESMWAAFSGVVARLERRDVEPTVLFRDDHPKSPPISYSLLPPLDVASAHVCHYPTVGEAIATYYDRLRLSESIDHERNRLDQALNRRADALHRKIEALGHDKAIADDADTYRLYGELLMSSLHQIPKRAEAVSLPNLHDPDAGIVEIPLDPRHGAVENAQDYFKRYQKAKRGRHRIAQQLADARRDLGDVEAVHEGVAGYGRLSDLKRLSADFESRGWLRGETTRKKAQETTPYRVFSTRGWRLLVGRNDRENEGLITRVAARDDIWLHAKQTPGSHVIITNPERKGQVPMPVLLAAAKLAAHYSKARHSSQVPVDYTRVRYVVRPKRTAAGFVTYSREKTLYVQPAPPSDIFASETR